jgi:glutamate synthase domain-containing protein 1
MGLPAPQTLLCGTQELCIIAARPKLKEQTVVCGIVGFLDRRAAPSPPLGNTLLAMLQALGCRGPDSAGVALFSEPGPLQLRLSLPASTALEAAAGTLHQLGLRIHRRWPTNVLDGIVEKEVDAADLEGQLRQLLPGSEVLCLGHHLSLFKQVGSPAQLEHTYHISELTGTHAIGHTRLSTESKVDLSHSQPFWAHGVLDLATVHNGHITNYHKLRRLYEQRGHRFWTENDSEVIGIYLRDRMNAGLSLPAALRSSLDDFDGSFSYLAAWPGGLAYVRDCFGFKPLLLAETEDWVALATEEVALRQGLGPNFTAREVPTGTLQIWEVPMPAEARRQSA